jgi:hypothetical protein
MQKHISISENKEGGFVLIVAMLILFLLTIIGISATSTTSIELQVAVNDSRQKRNYYRAEAANLEALQQIGSPTLNINAPPSWLKPYNENSLKNIRDNKDSIWKDAQPGSIKDTGYIIIGPVDAGGSVDYANPQKMTDFYVFGRYFKENEPERGLAMVETGYRVWEKLE